MKQVRGHRYLYERGGAFVFRRAIPPAARSAFAGRSEVWVSLGNRSLAEARHLLARELAKFEDTVSSYLGVVSPTAVIEVPRITPTKLHIERAVRAKFRERLDRVPAVNRGSSEARQAATERLQQLKLLVGRLRSNLAPTSGDQLDQNTRWMMESVCEEHGFAIEEGDELWWHLFEVVTKAQIEAAQRQLQRLTGAPERTEDELFSDQRYLLDRDNASASVDAPPVSIRSLFDSYVSERKPAPATIKSFRPKIEAFREFVGHDNAAAVTKADLLRWKKHLLNGGGRSGRPLSPKTVRETYFAAVSAVFQWAVDDEKLPSNVATGLKVYRPKGQSVRKGFRDSEMRLILKSALLPQDGRLSPERKFAIRWVPWILAYTGARVNEITQLRAEDFQKRDGIWIVHITPEAGTTKNQRARDVPLHPHLIEQGLIDQVENRSGPLFFDAARRRGGSDENPQARKVGEFLARWVREIGVDDPKVQPNHGWRHSFKSVARNCRMAPEIRDYIQGHVPRSEGENYGEVSPSAALREIKLIPQYRV